MLDPDGLRLLAGASALVCLVLAWRAGSVSAGSEERDEEPAGRLGFSDRSAGVCALWGVVTGVFVWSAVQALGLWSIAACAAMCLAAPVLFAVGRTKPAQPSAPEAALGRVLCIPAKLVFRVFGLSAEAAVTEEDLLSMVDDAEEDVIDEERKEMIANIVELDDVTAGDIMTHRTELVSVEDTATTGEAVHLAAQAGVSRLPVYRRSIDDVAGILHVKDLLAVWDEADRSDRSVTKYMRAPMFVTESCPAQELLVEFRRRHTQVAIVVDEYGGTSGLVTMEDVLEEIVGSIQDEFDNEEEEIVPFEGGVFAVGSADLEDVFDALDTEMPEYEDDDGDGEPDFDTVGGLVADRLGHVPVPGENVEIEYGGLLFKVLAASERRVRRVKVTRAPQPPKEEDA